MNLTWTPDRDADPSAVELSAPSLPPAPNQVRTAGMTWIEVVYERAAVMSLLPPGLEPVDALTGGFMAYDAPVAAGMAAYSNAKAWIDVKGHDAPGNRPAGFYPVVYFPGPFRQRLLRTWNSRVDEGGSREERRGDLITNIGGPPGEDHLRMTVELLPDDAPVTSWISHLIGEQGGDLSISRIPVVARRRPARPVSLDITAPAGHALHLLRPREIRAAWRVEDASFTHGFVTKLSDVGPRAAETVKTNLLRLLAHFGRGALLVTDEGRILFANAAAAELLGATLARPGRRLRLATRRDQAAVDGLLAAAVKAGAAPGPVLVAGTGEDQRLLVEAVSAAALDDVAGAYLPGSRPVVILLLTDPQRPAGKMPLEALQLLGLVPYEARVAALVGAGMSPREAAAELGIAESTVRSALTRIYDKLSIHRQSGLTRLVGHLRAVGR